MKLTTKVFAILSVFMGFASEALCSQAQNATAVVVRNRGLYWCLKRLKSYFEVFSTWEVRVKDVKNYPENDFVLQLMNRTKAQIFWMLQSDAKRLRKNYELKYASLDSSGDKIKKLTVAMYRACLTKMVKKMKFDDVGEDFKFDDGSEYINSMFLCESGYGLISQIKSFQKWLSYYVVDNFDTCKQFLKEMLIEMQYCVYEIDVLLKQFGRDFTESDIENKEKEIKKLTHHYPDPPSLPFMQHLRNDMIQLGKLSERCQTLGSAKKKKPKRNRLLLLKSPVSDTNQSHVSGQTEISKQSALGSQETEKNANQENAASVTLPSNNSAPQLSMPNVPNPLDGSILSSEKSASVPEVVVSKAILEPEQLSSSISTSNRGNDGSQDSIQSPMPLALSLSESSGGVNQPLQPINGNNNNDPKDLSSHAILYDIFRDNPEKMQNLVEKISTDTKKIIIDVGKASDNKNKSSFSVVQPNAENGLRPFSVKKSFNALALAGSCYLVYRKYTGQPVIPQTLWKFFAQKLQKQRIMGSTI